MYKVLSFTGIESRFFVVNSVPSHIPVQPPSELNGVLDRSLVSMGTAVPQTMWTPSSAEDKTQPIGEEGLQMPIFFEHTDGRLGLTLELAAAGQCHGLINTQRFAPLGPNQKAVTDIRIMVSVIYCYFVSQLLIESVQIFKWLGYKEFHCQIQIRDETRERNPITIAKLAHHVGRSVDAFLKVKLSHHYEINSYTETRFSPLDLPTGP